MANMMTGNLRIYGKKENVCNFLFESIQGISTGECKLDVDIENFEILLSFKNEWNWNGGPDSRYIKGTNGTFIKREYVDKDIEIPVFDFEDDIIGAILPIYSKWEIEDEPLCRLSKKYKIAFAGSFYEKGYLIKQKIIIINGEMIKKETKKYRKQEDWFLSIEVEHPEWGG